MLSDRVQRRYPGLLCDLAEGMFTVTNPAPKPGGLRVTRDAAARHGVTLRQLAADTLRGLQDLRMSGRSPDGGAGSPSRSAWPPWTSGSGPAPTSPSTSDVCRSCTTQACVTACPANLFAPTADGGILFNYEECFECGTCYMVCNREGAITWTYPDGGHGVVFHHG